MYSNIYKATFSSDLYINKTIAKKTYCVALKPMKCLTDRMPIMLTIWQTPSMAGLVRAQDGRNGIGTPNRKAQPRMAWLCL